jgi:folate-binding protein YgfZ
MTARQDCHTAKLGDRGVVAIIGEEAESFLQGLVTSDMAKVKERALYSALLTPQGKLLFDFFIVPAEDGDGYWLDCAADQTSDLLKRLTLYKLRARIELENLSRALAVHVAWGKGVAADFGLPDEAGAVHPVKGGGMAYVDPRLPELGVRLILPADADEPVQRLGVSAAQADDWHAHRIALGVPEGNRDFAPDSVFPLDVNFEALHGVDFKKGCFVGQEVTARMKHRGTARKRVLMVESEAPLPAAGAAIAAGGTALGELIAVDGARGLALIRLDRLEKAEEEGAAPMAGDVAVRLKKPDWLTV